MKQEYNKLKNELKSATEQIQSLQQAAQTHANTCVGIKNAMKTVEQNLAQEMQEIREEQSKVQQYTNTMNNTMKALKDSQVSLKKQIQTTNAVHKQQIDSQTKQAHESSTDTERDNEADSAQEKAVYTVTTQNKFDPLSRPSAKDTSTSSTNSSQHVTQGNHTLISQHKTHNTPHTTHSSQRSTTQRWNQQNNPLQSNIPRDCRVLLIGDSATHGLKDTDVPAHIICVPGMTIKQLGQWLSASSPQAHIYHVTVHAGLDSCHDIPISVDVWVSLSRALKRAFPNAIIQLSSMVPPVGNHPLRQAASTSTSNLSKACEAERVTFINNTPDFMTKSGAPKKVMYKDRLHPSTRGCNILAHNLCQKASSPNSRVNNNQPQRRPSPTFNNDFPRLTPMDTNRPEAVKILGKPLGSPPVHQQGLLPLPSAYQRKDSNPHPHPHSTVHHQPSAPTYSPASTQRSPCPLPPLLQHSTHQQRLSQSILPPPNPYQSHQSQYHHHQQPCHGPNLIFRPPSIPPPHLAPPPPPPVEMVSWKNSLLQLITQVLQAN